MNASRGPVVDETALVEHLKANPMFRVGLDVFEVKRLPLQNHKNVEHGHLGGVCVCLSVCVYVFFVFFVFF